MLHALVARDCTHLRPAKEHHVNVAEGIELAPSIATKRDQCERGRARLLIRADRSKEMAQQHVHQIRATRGNIPAAAAGMMTQPQPMLFDF